MTEANGSSLVSVIIVTRNRREFLLRCLLSVLETDYKPFELIVVDDSSSDGTQTIIKESFPNVRLLTSEKRMLLAESRNFGIRKSRGKYVFILDDDNVVQPDTVKRLVDVLKSSHGVGVVVPVAYYFSQPERVWWAGAKFNFSTGLTTIKHKDELSLIEGAPYESQTFHNAWIMTRDVIEKVGLFDERNFPFFLSELDYSIRMRKSGLSVLVVPEAKVWHDVSFSSGRIRSLTSMHIRNSTRAYFVGRNRIVLLWRYRRSLASFLRFLFIFEPMFFFVQVFSILASDSSEKGLLTRNYIHGFLDALSYVLKGGQVGRL